MTKIRAAIVGYGNIGHFVLEALQTAPDFEIAGVVRRNPSVVPAELSDYKVTDDIHTLGKVDVAILCTPTREVEKHAAVLLAEGINTVDSYDIHSSIATCAQNSTKLHASMAQWQSSQPVGIRAATPLSAPFFKQRLPRVSPTQTSDPA